MRRADLLTAAAITGLLAVLAISTFFTFIFGQGAQQREQVADHALALSDAYKRVNADVNSEESLNRKYRLEPGPLIARSHASAAAMFAKDIETVVTLSSPAGAAEAKKLVVENAAFLAATREMFAAADARDSTRATVLDHAFVDPAFRDIAGTVAARAAESDATAARALDDLYQMHHDVMHAAVFFMVLRALCIGALLFSIAAYRRRISDTYRAEIHALRKMVAIDALTKIGNHRSFKEDIEREVALADRYGGTLTLAVLDVDEFKVINDERGHVRGDAVLVALAELLRNGRAGDTAYRIGGDEFALILPQTSSADAHQMLERVRIASSTVLEGGTVSIGHASHEPEGGDAEELQNRADAALYISKRSGRNGVSAYDSSSEGTWLLSTARVRKMHELLASGEINIAFQPIWDIETKRILAYEALARPPAEFGFVGPQDAFDVAERIGCAHELDALCREAALARAADLPKGALLFLNASPQTLDRNLDIASLQEAVTAVGLRPERVVIEITERSIAHVDAVVATAGALGRAGFLLALDDTGAGHSGLELLSRVRFDFVKIDREIILKGMSDRNARGVVAAIVSFARVAGAYVIAEGIEDTAMLDFVDSAGPASSPAGRGICGAQGYLLCRPSETFPKAAEVRAVVALLREHITEEAARPAEIAIAV